MIYANLKKEDYIKNNKKEFKTLNLNKIIFIEKPIKNEIDDL